MSELHSTISLPIQPPLLPPGVQFREIPGHPGYGVTSTGEVWSCQRQGYPRRNSPPCFGSWHRLRPGLTGRKRTYWFVTLRRRKACYVHHLVLLAFVGPCPPGMESCHNDGNPSNNHLSNLRWDTRRNNHADKKHHGTDHAGSRHPNAILTEADIEQILHLRQKERLPVKDIAILFEVHPSTITNVLTGVRWKHVLPPQ